MSKIYNLTNNDIHFYQSDQMKSLNYIKEGETPYRIIKRSISTHSENLTKYGGVSNDRGDDGESPICVYVTSPKEFDFDFTIITKDDIIIAEDCDVASLIKNHPDLIFAVPIRTAFNDNGIAGCRGISIIK